MKSVSHKLLRIGTLLALLWMFGWAENAQAQWITKWLSVGRLHHPYLSGGAEPENLIPDAYMFWPGIAPGTTHEHWKGLWISAKNYTDETGQNWEIRTSHIGPRGLGLGEFFDISHKMISRFDPPVVKVDGFETFQRAIVNDEVDPNLAPDRMIESIINTSIGVSLHKKAMQWSNPHHEDYHLVEYVFSNTGNVDDDEEIEVQGQTLNDVYFVFFNRPKVNAPAGSWDNSQGGNAWGEATMNDAIGDGHEDYGVTDMRAQFSWLGYSPGKSNEYNTLGNPMWYNHQWNSVQNDTLGRLGGAQMFGTVTVHADAQAHPAGQAATDDPAQPRTMTYIESDWSDITTGNDHTNTAKMRLERDLIERGAKGSPGTVAPVGEAPRTWPHHAYVIEPDGDFTHPQGNPSLGRAGGWGYMNAYGPYQMAPNEEVKIVVAEGVAGLDDVLKWNLGRAYKLGGGVQAEEMLFSYDADGSGTIDADERMTKNEWMMTTRDSLFSLFRASIANYRNMGASLPALPMPPMTFEVTSGTDKIELAWEAFPGGEPQTGWEVWRAQKAYNTIITALRIENGVGVPDSARAYECIAGCPGTPALAPGARSFTDPDVDRGQSYFYYLQAVNPPALDPTTGHVHGSKSNRYYAQTFEPAFLRRAPGENLSSIRIVPNPYTLQATSDLRFDVQDRLAFFGLPGQATIKIYTELGELVQTIEHTDGSGDDFWNLTTSSSQVVVSGLYIAVIENKDEGSPEFGEQVIQKFVVIR